MAVTTSGIGDQPAGIGGIGVPLFALLVSGIVYGTWPLGQGGSWMPLSSVWVNEEFCRPKTAKNASSSMIRLGFMSPGLRSCRAQSKLVPWMTGPTAPIAWLGTSKKSNILNQPSAAGPPTT